MKKAVPQRSDVVARQEREAFDAEMNEKAESRMNRQTEQDAIDAKQLQNIEKARQKELADLERLKLQDANSHYNQVKANDAAELEQAGQREKTMKADVARSERGLHEARAQANAKAAASQAGQNGAGEIGASEREAKIQTIMNKGVVTPEEQTYVETQLGPNARMLPNEGISMWKARVTGLMKAERARLNAIALLGG